MRRFVPHDYQRQAIAWLFARTVGDPCGGAALFLDPGLGKTSITLSWIRGMKSLGLVKKVLIVAPIRVVYSVWPAEVRKWEQMSGLRVQILHGTPTARMKALATDADIYLVNPEVVPALQTYFAKRDLPFDAVVLDESSKFKTWGSARTKALRKLLPRFRYRIVLTGTPSPNGLIDLFSQIFAVDLGASLGTSITKFRDRFFFRGGFGGYQYFPHDSAAATIESKISKICLRMDAADHLDLPALVTNDVWIDLPPKAREAYDQMEKKMFLELESGVALNEGGEEEELTPMHAGARYLALRQLANGGIYLPKEEGEKVRSVLHLHDAKLEAAVDLIAELGGKPAILAFQFRHDLERVRKHWPKTPSIDGSTSGKETDRLVEQWNAGRLPLLAVQPQALSHGVNMQSGPGRDLIWIGLGDSLEVYLQLNARLYRQGVVGQVRIHRILARDTVDVLVRKRIEDKDESQKSLLDSLKSYAAEVSR